MKILRSLPATASDQPCALAIGNFDGVHRGHVALLEHLGAEALASGMVSTVLTFYPHPRQFFALRENRTADAPTTITALRSKLAAIAKTGVERTVLLRFDENLAELTAEEFIENILVDRLNVKWLLVGEAFRFGKDRYGTTGKLAQAAKKYGFHLQIMPQVMENGDRISSSAVRDALKNNDFVRAGNLLGQPYHISGHVIHGDKRGRLLGFPTINLPMRHFNPILSGVYITLVHGLRENPLPAVSMIGHRRSVDEVPRVVLETHILHYNEDCYGALVQVEFLKKLRDNQKFASLQALSAAIGQDIQHADAFFAGERRRD